MGKYLFMKWLKKMGKEKKESSYWEKVNSQI